RRCLVRSRFVVPDLRRAGDRQEPAHGGGCRPRRGSRLGGADRPGLGGGGVRTGRCWEGGGAPAYWPWIQVVRAAGGEFDGLASTPVVGRLSEGTQGSPVDPEAARFRLFGGVRGVLVEGARPA